jgi:hypothetical protein
MEPSELLLRVAGVLDGLAIRYLVTGSMATIAYGEPRFTNDIDVVVQMRPAHVAPFCKAFPADEFYCSRDAVAQAVREHFQFNIIHPASGLKVDIIVAADSDFDRARFARGRCIATDADHLIRFAAPEDVILKKLLYFQEGGSEKHLRDIIGVLKVQAERIDRSYLDVWVVKLGVAAEWQLVTTRLTPEPGNRHEPKSAG